MIFYFGQQLNVSRTAVLKHTISNGNMDEDSKPSSLGSHPVKEESNHGV